MFHRISSSIKLSHCITKTIYSIQDNVIIIKETLQQDEDTSCTRIIWKACL